MLDQLLRVAPAQALGGVLVDRGDVVALGRADDGAERGRGVEDRRRLLLLPAQPLSTTWGWNREALNTCFPQTADKVFFAKVKSNGMPESFY